MKKVKCAACNKQKGRRDCRLHDGALVCSVCCATVRNLELCGDCQHFQGRDSARERFIPKTVIIEVNEELEEEVDDILCQVENGILKHHEALAKLNRLRVDNPKNHIVYFGLAVIHIHDKNNDEAMACLDRSISINPLFVEAYINKAALYQIAMDITNSIKTHWKIMDLTPSGSESHSRSKSFIRSIEKIARKDANISLESYVRAAEIFAQGFELVEKKQFDNAIAVLEQGLKVNPKHHQTYGTLGLCYAGLGKKSKALEMLTNALKLDPSYEPARMNLAAIESMTEGEPLDGYGVSIDYSKGKFNGDYGARTM